MTSLSAIRSWLPGLSAVPGAQQAGLAGLAPGGPAGGAVPATGTEGVRATTGADSSFSDVLGGLVNDVNGKQVQAGRTVQGLQAGENVSLHQAMIAIEEASVSFQLMVEVRNKLLESYQELMRMQV